MIAKRGRRWTTVACAFWLIVNLTEGSFESAGLLPCRRLRRGIAQGRQHRSVSPLAAKFGRFPETCGSLTPLRLLLTSDTKPMMSWGRFHQT
jgi:hypothetical protein